ncbi:AMP-binding protein, partial [Escherichia coli]|nr:AMP-binding protein [Escherichia coli]
RKSTLTNICCGGERISNIYKEYQTIYNSYGLSETLSIAIAFALDKPYDNPPIGKPLEDFTVYLLDEEGRQVKEGEEGEICI